MNAFEIVLDALIDTVKLLPFILIIYILIEILEHNSTVTRNQKLLQGKLAPLIGSSVGIIPQCGFSVMAAKLYDSGLIRTGTVLAVFLATSDEALIILLSDINHAYAVMPIILIKLIVGIGVGYLVNFLLSNEKLSEVHSEAEIQTTVCCHHNEKNSWEVYFFSPLWHSLKIALYLLIVNLVFGFIVGTIGEENMGAALIGGTYLQPFLTALIGLIPSCASSVILTGAFTQGGILFGSLVCGLCSNAGLGFMILLKNTKKIKRNVLLIITCYLIAVVVGIIINAICLAAGLTI